MTSREIDDKMSYYDQSKQTHCLNIDGIIFSLQVYSVQAPFIDHLESLVCRRPVHRRQREHNEMSERGRKN